MAKVIVVLQTAEVDFTLAEVRVTFDRPMQTERAWSWIIHQRELPGAD